MATAKEQASEIDTKNGLESFGPGRRLVGYLAIFVTLLPIANVFWIITTVGCDNVSNDYLTYAHLIDRTMTGDYNYSALISDTFYRGHATTLAFLTHLASAKWFWGSVMPELYLGFTLALLRFYFWYDALRATMKVDKTYWLLPLISFFVFSNSQISLFTYPGAALPIGISLFGQALGVWALARFKTSWKGVILASIGALVSSYSWGIGPITCLILLGYYLFLRGFEWKKFLTLMSSAALSAIPYIMALFVKGDSTAAVDPTKTIVSLFNTKTIINLLGWPLARDIATSTGNLKEAQFAGFMVLIMAIVLIILLILIRHRIELKQTAIPLILMLSSFLTIWEVSMVRSLLAPWYATLAIPFWVGFIALATLVFNQLSKDELDDMRIRITIKWSMLALVIAIACYARSNQTIEDKTYLLNARAPASVSALYHAESAPTYADQYVFLWTPGSPSLLQKLAEVLEKHNISVFGPMVKLFLQGDFMLSSVDLNTEAGSKSAYFTDNLSTLSRANWSDYKKLDLVLPPGSSIRWRLNIPDNLKEGRLTTLILKVDGKEKDTGKDHNQALISIRELEPNKTIAISQTVLANGTDQKKQTLDLNQYKGKAIEIEFVNKIKKEAAPTYVFKKPQVALLLDKSEKTKRKTPFNWLPDNTEFGTTFNADSPPDFVIDTTSTKNWKAHNGEIENTNDKSLKAKSTANEATFEYKQNLNIPIDQISNLVVRIAADGKMKQRVLKFSLKTSDIEKRYVSFYLPLLGTESPVSYKYPTRLLNLLDHSVIESLSFKTMDPNTNITLNSLGFQ